MFMLRVTVQQLGDASVLSCEGRLVVGDAYSSLRNAVFGQTEARIVFLDVVQVDRVDAGGLGLLLGLREWARSRGIRFKLMNVTRNVDQLLELANLQRVFEFCTVPELLCLLHRAASNTSLRAELPNPRDANHSPESPLEAQDLEAQDNVAPSGAAVLLLHLNNPSAGA
jgi:anti-anti-sigma factor